MNAIISKFASLLPKSVQWALLIGACTYWLGMQVNYGFDTLRTDLVNQARQPAYEIIYNQLEKQMEKLAKDPDDIKQVDLKFAYNQCNGDFRAVYVKSLMPSESASITNTCEKIEDLYLNDRKYTYTKEDKTTGDDS